MASGYMGLLLEWLFCVMLFDDSRLIRFYWLFMIVCSFVFAGRFGFDVYMRWVNGLVWSASCHGIWFLGIYCTSFDSRLKYLD